MSRSALLFLHLVGAILLFSTYITAFVTKTIGERTRDVRIVAHVFHVMNRVDQVLTPVSIVLLLATGFALAARAGIPILETRWLAWSLALFGLTGILFVIGALPLQRRIERLLEGDEQEDEGADGWWDAYHRLSLQWLTVAGTSFIMTVGILYLMIH